MNPYIVTYYGQISVRVDAKNKEEALEKSEEQIIRRNKDFDYINFRVEVEIDDEY